MKKTNRIRLFDKWAEVYDEKIHSRDDFPFVGYDEVLDEIFRLAVPMPEAKILDLGTGTGNLAEVFIKSGCNVWGIDFSSEMLRRAREKLPQAHFVEADLLSQLPDIVPSKFDRVVSAYVFHEFDLSTKISLIGRFMQTHLDNDGYMVIGDISFEDKKNLDHAQKRWKNQWDDEEFYWIADDTIQALGTMNIMAEYRQISDCGGVYRIRQRK